MTQYVYSPGPELAVSLWALGALVMLLVVLFVGLPALARWQRKRRGW